MHSALELTNRLRSEAGRVSESGLPLDVFPQKVQEIIFNLAAYENFNIEYSASIVLSAVAAAVGNACQIQICSERLLSGTVQQCICLRMDSPANRISLSLMHMKPDSGTLSNIAAILKSSGRTIISRRNHGIFFDNHCSVFPLDAGAPVCKIFCTV